MIITAPRHATGRLPVLLSALCFLSLPSCQSGRSGDAYVFSGATMGTTYSVMINAPALPLPEQRMRAEISAALDEVNRVASTWLPDSELMRFNRTRTTDWIPLSQALLDMLQAAGEISRLTEGAFDVTAGPVINLWGFGPAEGRRVPAQRQIDAALRQSGYQKLQLDAAASAAKKPATDLFADLSAIAKGYAVDRIAGYLERLSLDNYLVEIGGELRARGLNPDDAPWRVGIEQPVAGRRAVQKIIRLDNIAMATSGDYRNFFEQDGVRYSHLIDPRNGRPVTHRLASVTVLHPAAMRADAWATGLLVLGPEKGYALALKERIAACFIIRTDTGFKEKSTPAFRPYAAAGE